MHQKVYDLAWLPCLYVIVVPWASRVYGICTLSVVICIPEGEALGNTYNEALGNTYNYTKGTNPYTAEAHGTADLYHDSIN